MKPISLSGILIFFVFHANGDQWIQLNSSTQVGGNSPSTEFVVNGRAYVLEEYYGINTNFFYEYDPINDSWTQKANLPIRISAGGVGFSIGSKGYIGLGFYSGAAQQLQVWEFDPIGNSWTRKADFPGLSREDPFSFTVGTSAFVGCGYGYSTGVFNDVWEYDQLTNNWTQRANYPHFGGALSGEAYLNFGYVSYGDSISSTTEMWQYDPINDAWNQKNSCTHLMMLNASFLIGRYMYVGMGTGILPAALPDFWCYDILFDQWYQVATFPGIPRFKPAAFSIGNYGYLAFGDNSIPWHDVFQYTPDSIVGIYDPGKIKAEIWLYPNITNNFIFVTLEDNIDYILTATIIDKDGKRMMPVLINSKYDIQNLAAGYYFLDILTFKKRRYIKKFIKF